jgi:hypothetical protein
VATTPRGTEGAASARLVELAGDSPEVVAFALLRQLVHLEQGASKDRSRIDRAWLLDTYAECLEAVKGERRSRAAKPVGRKSST